ncbi:hypothetical protein FH972_022425 [Carpinus fangiana]|uniref:Myb-like domain-containing protein n=1 Tax=Carpinus fangiana TaxID=176857 RepID=A0A5N6KS86_9ROSI|nr:hypothetical protein FH972_022425 [Carpinus fangiana]
MTDDGSGKRSWPVNATERHQSPSKKQKKDHVHGFHHSTDTGDQYDRFDSIIAHDGVLQSTEQPLMNSRSSSGLLQSQAHTHGYSLQTSTRRTTDGFRTDPRTFANSRLLPLLLQMATTLLDYVVHSSPEQLVTMSGTGPEGAPQRQEYMFLLGPFRNVRDRFRSSGTYFIDPTSVTTMSSRLGDPTPHESVNIINTASAVVELLNPSYQAMIDLQARLPDIFKPFSRFIQADRMELIAGLLTQVHITRQQESRTRPELVREDPFSQDLERRFSNGILGEDNDSLRNEFWLKCRTIRQQLLNSTLADLMFSDCRLRFLRSLHKYLGETVNLAAQEFTEHHVVLDSVREQTGQSDLPMDEYTQNVETGNEDGDDDAPFELDIMEQVRIAARQAREEMDSHNHDRSSQRLQVNKTQAEGSNNQASSASSQPQPAASGNVAPSAGTARPSPQPTTRTSGPVPIPSSSPPIAVNLPPQLLNLSSDTATADLYKKARLEDVMTEREKYDRANASAGQRKPWSEAEELALMQGLDKVQGPHWARILAMFGPNGSVSEVLKDRSQVQCKDKARNLKLYFLKRGDEVPAGLQLVTGELKTRAPGRVVKNEMHEQLQHSASEDKATQDAISVLTGGTRSADAEIMPMQGMRGRSSSSGTLGGTSPAHGAVAVEPLA